jgi:hypothetical protein
MDDIEIYIASLSKKETVAYLIAKSQLGSTFSMEKSNGFLTWKKQRASEIVVAPKTA